MFERKEKAIREIEGMLVCLKNLLKAHIVYEYML